MASVLHGSARTTPRLRAELQASKESTRSLAGRYGLNPKTVAKWRKRTTTSDAPMGPKDPRSTVLTPAEEAIVVEDAAAAGRRAGLSDGHHPQPQPQRLAPLPPTPWHIPAAGRRARREAQAVQDLRDRLRSHRQLRAASRRRQDGGLGLPQEHRDRVPLPDPHRAHRQRLAFADLPKNRHGPGHQALGAHIFDRVCNEHGIEHRLTKPYHPWTNGPAERMNRTVKDATVKIYHYEDLKSLQAHVLALRHRLQLRQAPQGSAVANALPGHLRRLDEKTPQSSRSTRTISSRDHTTRARQVQAGAGSGRNPDRAAAVAHKGRR